VKSPDGQSVEGLANVEPELDTDRNSMSGTWRTEAPEIPALPDGCSFSNFRDTKTGFSMFISLRIQ
jgi:hypothetical protein